MYHSRDTLLLKTCGFQDYVKEHQQPDLYRKTIGTLYIFMRMSLPTETNARTSSTQPPVNSNPQLIVMKNYEKINNKYGPKEQIV